MSATVALPRYRYVTKRREAGEEGNKAKACREITVRCENKRDRRWQAQQEYDMSGSGRRHARNRHHSAKRYGQPRRRSRREERGTLASQRR